MSDDFDHEADAVDRFLNGEGDGEVDGWECARCGYINDYGAQGCRGCGTPERECGEIDPALWSNRI
jgi:uncharacterized OB-fold protein